MLRRKESCEELGDNEGASEQEIEASVSNSSTPDFVEGDSVVEFENVQVSIEAETEKELDNTEENYGNSVSCEIISTALETKDSHLIEAEEDEENGNSAFENSVVVGGQPPTGDIGIQLGLSENELRRILYPQKLLCFYSGMASSIGSATSLNTFDGDYEMEPGGDTNNNINVVVR